MTTNTESLIKNFITKCGSKTTIGRKALNTVSSHSTTDYQLTEEATK